MRRKEITQTIREEKRMSWMGKVMVSAVAGAAVLSGAVALSSAYAQEVKGPKVTWKFNVWGKKRAFTADVEAWSKFVAEKTGGLDEELGVGADWVLGLDFGVEGDDAGVGVEVDGADTADRHAGHEDDGVSLEAVDVFCLEVQQGGLGEWVGALGEVDDERGCHRQRDGQEQADFPFCLCFHG